MQVLQALSVAQLKVSIHFTNKHFLYVFSKVLRQVTTVLRVEIRKTTKKIIELITYIRLLIAACITKIISKVC